MGIYDAMMLCRVDVQTYCFGLAASMGAFLLGAGKKGKRHRYGVCMCVGGGGRGVLERYMCRARMVQGWVELLVGGTAVDWQPLGHSC